MATTSTMIAIHVDELFSQLAESDLWKIAPARDNAKIEKVSTIMRTNAGTMGWFMIVRWNLTILRRLFAGFNIQKPLIFSSFSSSSMGSHGFSRSGRFAAIQSSSTI